MEIEQLVSFVRYQRGQKQGWDALDEVLTIVQEATERVKSAEGDIKVAEARVAELTEKAGDIEESIDSKLAELEVELESKRADSLQASEKRQAELDKLVKSKGYEIEALDATLLGQTKLAEKLALEINDLQADKSTLEAELAKIRNVLADIKAKL